MPHLNDLPPLSLGGLLPARDGHVEANLAEGICVGAPGDRPYAFGAESLRSLKQVFHPFTPPTQSLVEALTYWSQQQPDEVAYYYLVDGEQEEFAITYQQLERRAQEIAGKLQSMGMAGQRALLLYPPGPDFVMGFFGCLYAGMTAVPAYPPRRNRNMGRIQAIADDAGAKVALTVSDVLERTQGLLDETPKLKQLHWISTDQINGESLCHWREPVIEHDDIAFLQYTSGSTGTPKGVMISHGNMMHNLAIISQGFEYFREGKGMTWLPTYHDMGLVGGVLAPIYYGRPNIVMSPMSFLQKPLRWLQAIDKYRVAVSGGPNFAYDLCVQKIAPEQTKGLDLSCWVVAFNGAEPVRPQTIKKFSEAFASCGFKPEAFYPCYGMAETTLIVTGGARAAKPVFKAFDGEALGDHRVVPADPNDASARLLVGCGQALPQTELIIVDPQTRTRLAEGEVGEIWIASPSVGKGYLHKNELTEEVFRARLANNGQGPYLRTGDLGFLADGEVFVTGRLKDLIIIRGVNRYPQDIESTVERASDRLQPGASAAIAVDVAGRERLIVIAEVARKRQRDGWNEVIDAIRRDVTLEHDVPPDAVILVRAGSIPKTSSGKIQRHACRDGFIEGSLSGVAQWCSWVEEREEETPSAAEVVEDARRKGLLSAEQLEAVDPKVVVPRRRVARNRNPPRSGRGHREIHRPGTGAARATGRR